jgi:hypothetical protein
MEKAREWGAKIPIGIFYRDPNPRPSLDKLDPALDGGVPLVQQPYTISREKRRKLIEEFM